MATDIVDQVKYCWTYMNVDRTQPTKSFISIEVLTAPWKELGVHFLLISDYFSKFLFLYVVSTTSVEVWGDILNRTSAKEILHLRSVLSMAHHLTVRLLPAFAGNGTSDNASSFMYPTAMDV